MSVDAKASLPVLRAVMEAYERGEEPVVKYVGKIFDVQRRDFARMLNNIRRGDGFIQAKTSLPADGVTPWIHGADLVRVGASLSERLLEEGEDYQGANMIRFNRPVTQNLNLYVSEDRSKLPDIDPIVEMELLSSNHRVLHCIAEATGQPVEVKITPDVFAMKIAAYLQMNTLRQRLRSELSVLIAQQMSDPTERLVGAFNLASFGSAALPGLAVFDSTLIASVYDLRFPPKDWMVNGLEFSVRDLGPKKPASSGAQIQDVGIDIESPEKTSLAQVRFALCKRGKVDLSGKLVAS